MAQKFHDLPFGYIGSYDDNEVEIVSTMRDPPKIRLSVDANKVESNLGSVSFNIRRSDGRHEEMAYVMGRLTAGKTEGAMYLAVRGPGEQQPHEVLYLDAHQAIFRVPVSAPGLGSGGGSGYEQGRFYSGDGKFCYQVQDDPASGPAGRIVVYNTHFNPWRAVGIMSPTLL